MWCAVALLACAVPRGGRASFVAIDPSAHAARLGDDYEWAVRSVPFVELAADDDVVAAFYYRWRVLRKHVAWTGAPDGYVITEFLREVSWWQDDDRDAMEVSISGPGCRPTIASAMWGEADAIARIWPRCRRRTRSSPPSSRRGPT